jgi:hypothetical protein
MRFPPPWTLEDIGAAFVVKDSNGQQLAYVYYEDEPGRPSHVPSRSIKLTSGGGDLLCDQSFYCARSLS